LPSIYFPHAQVCKTAKMRNSDGLCARLSEN
jgi:hypothetical protein